MIPAIVLACALSATECHSLDAQRIASAIDDATGDDRLRAVLVVYAYHESRWQVRPAPSSWDARAGVARGPWQLWTGGTLTLRDQARVWLSDVQSAGLAGVDSSPARASRRAREAQALLGRVGD